MGLKYEIMDKILKVFYENSDKRFTVREISKLAKIPKSTIQTYLKHLKAVNLIDQENRASKNLLFRTKKKTYYVNKLVETGLIDYLINVLNPSCIILFGSISKGDSDKDSDIDIFIETFVKRKVNLIKFEKKINHKIDLHIKENIKDLHKHLHNNVINGIKLYGVIKL